MKRKNIRRAWLLSVATVLVLVCPRSSQAVQPYGTTVIRDPGGCKVYVIVQIAVIDNSTEPDSVNASYNRVKTALERCFNVSCSIPCARPPACPIIVTVDVKKWDDIPALDRDKYHQVHMVEPKYFPRGSYSYGVYPPNGPGGQAVLWRVPNHRNAYGHEVLHLCGLEDEYCARNINPWEVEPVCDHGPDPCDSEEPTVQKPRTCKSCYGYANDIMGALDNNLSCSNIERIVKAAQEFVCPEWPCCPAPPPPCSDGIDNDGDGCADYPCDTGCESATDTSEEGGSCCDGGGAVTPRGLVVMAMLLLATGVWMLLRPRVMS